MSIHTFGDSHAGFGWDICKNIKIHHLGPKLCFSMSRDGLDISKQYGVQDFDFIVFCFGEIDCRCHVHKYVNSSRSYTEVIDPIVDAYFIRIKESTSVFPNLKVGVYNVVPPVKKDTTAHNSEFPFLGSDTERKQYTLYFNQKLNQKCLEYGYIFVNVYDKYTDSEGYINREFSDGHVHIKNGIHIKNFIENRLTV
jgi:hypothetical protein